MILKNKYLMSNVRFYSIHVFGVVILSFFVSWDLSVIIGYGINITKFQNKTYNRKFWNKTLWTLWYELYGMHFMICTLWYTKQFNIAYACVVFKLTTKKRKLNKKRLK